MVKKFAVLSSFLLIASVYGQSSLRNGFTGGTVSSTITETATTPFVLTLGGATSGSFNAIVFKTNETGVPRPGQASQALGNFNLVMSLTAASNGAGRRDNIINYGYNPSSSPSYVSNDDQFFFTFENSYTTGASIRQGEFYFVATSGDGAMNARPFGIIPAYDLHTIDVAVRANTFEIGDIGEANDWAQFQTTSSSGILALKGNSRISYDNTNADWIYSVSTPLLGYDVTNSAVRIGPGVNSLSLFANNNVTNSSITFGKLDTAAHNRGLRYNSGVWQFQTGDSTWQNMGVPVGQYVVAGGANTGFGPTAFSNTGGSTLEVYNATATTGATQLRVRAGAGQNLNLIDVANNGDTSIWKVDTGGTMWGTYFRELSNTFALQSGFDSTNVLLLGSGKKIAFSSTANFYDTLDLNIGRGIAGRLDITSDGGTTNYRDIKVRNVIQTGAPVVGSSAAIVATGRVTAQTAANSSIATYTVGAADSSFDVSMNMNSTAATVLSTSLNCDYTDESNTARTMIFPTTSLSGTFLSGGLITATGAFETPVMHIRCKASTAITLYTATGTFNTVTYTAEGNIKQTK